MCYKVRNLILLAGLFILFTSSLLISQDKIRIACIGNSITEGNMMSTKLFDAYPVVLGRYLGSGYEVKNCGVSGRTMLRKGDFPIWNEQLFKDGLAFNPNIITIMLGTNDSKSYNWIYKDEFVQDYIAMIDTFQHGQANPQIYLVIPPPSFIDIYDIRDSVLNADIIPMIKQIAAQKNLPTIDFNTFFLDKRELVPDGIHPQIEGSDLMARMLMKELTGREITLLTENNLALNKPAYFEGSSAGITDADIANGVTVNKTSGPIVINLGSDVETNLLQVDFTDFSISNFSFSISASSDSIDWITLADTSINASLLVPEKRISRLGIKVQPSIAHYVKIQVNGSQMPDDSSVIINRIKVFETRPLHAPIWGWQYVSETSTTMRTKTIAHKTSDVGEYIRMYKQTKETNPFYLFSNLWISAGIEFY